MSRPSDAKVLFFNSADASTIIVTNHIRSSTADQLTIWRFCDGKPGHERQTESLIQGLARLSEVDVVEIDVRGFNLLQSTEDWLESLDLSAGKPDIHIGAGHGTHLPMLRSRNIVGGKTVVLMKPSLPLSWFDVAIIPEHDNPPDRDNVLVSRGTLAPNYLRGEELDRSRGLILLGGESKAFDWSNSLVEFQVNLITNRMQHVDWIVSNSRRTPVDLTIKGTTNRHFHSWEDQGTDWLSEQLSNAGHIWVSIDSTSMLTEAMNTSASVHIIELPSRRKRNKIQKNVETFIADGQVSLFHDWLNESEGATNRLPLNDHLRCAELLKKTLEI